MLPLRDIPNQEGYEFTGICKDDFEIPCIVHKDHEGLHCAYSLATNLKGGKLGE